MHVKGAERVVHAISENGGPRNQRKGWSTQSAKRVVHTISEKVGTHNHECAVTYIKPLTPYRISLCQCVRIKTK